MTGTTIHAGSLIKRMLVGGGIALILLIIFLSGVKNPNPAWGPFWMIRPFIIVPFAGAMGGLCYHWIDRKLASRKVLVIVLSLIVYVIGLWMGMVLGFDGTLWD